MRLKISIVDDHEVALEGLKQLLVSSPIEIAGAYDSCAKAQASIDDSVDVVLLDVRLPSKDGLACLAAFRESHPKLPVVMFSAFDNPTYVARSVALKANDYVLKSDTRETIINAIVGASKGESAIQDGLFFRVKRAMMSEELPENIPQEAPLTSREAQVLRHIGLGLSNREIASSLEISIETVKEHVQNMLRKINASDRTDAAVRAVRFGLVD